MFPSRVQRVPVEKVRRIIEIKNKTFNTRVYNQKHLYDEPFKKLSPNFLSNNLKRYFSMAYLQRDFSVHSTLRTDKLEQAANINYGLNNP